MNDNNFVHIPKGFANGSMSFEDNSELLIFSTSSISESLKDDIRYEAKYWNPWKQRVDETKYYYFGCTWNARVASHKSFQ